MVVPLAGTWIETRIVFLMYLLIQSFPLRERGLKRKSATILEHKKYVVPLAGTWIETMVSPSTRTILARRSPCGNVD